MTVRLPCSWCTLVYPARVVHLLYTVLPGTPLSDIIHADTPPGDTAEEEHVLGSEGFYSLGNPPLRDIPAQSCHHFLEESPLVTRARVERKGELIR